MSSEVTPKLVSEAKIIKDIDFFLKIPVGLTIAGFISILISFIFDAYDAETVGYFVISAAIFNFIYCYCYI